MKRTKKLSRYREHGIWSV